MFVGGFCKAYTMQKGDVIEYIIEDEIWVRKKEVKEKKTHAGRPPELKRHIEKLPKNSTFDLNDYSEKHPNYTQYRDNFEKAISEMIDEKMLMQLSDSEFKVIGDKNGM